MQPYQKASEAIRSGEEYPLNILKSAGLTALGGGAAKLGSKAISNVIPAIASLLNKYIPENLSKSGLNKIDPRMGTFIEGGLSEGYTYDELRKFMEDKVEKSTQPKQEKNIVEQYSPDLHRFVSEKVKSGENPVKAAALALFQNGNPFETVIRKIEKDHKTNWSDLVQSIYGGAMQAAPEQSISQPEQQQQIQQQPTQQGAGQGTQALMSILQKINQRLGQ